jgi:6-phosphogluconolactonase (cycloisomerase 2 family)
VESHTVVLHFADGPAGTNYVDVTTSITNVDCVAIAYDPTSASGRLYILVEKQSGGGIDSYYTDNEGGSISVATVVSTTGTHVSVAINPMGKRIVAFRNSGGDLHRVIYDPQGNVITASSAVVASGVNNDQTAISWRLGNWYLYYHDNTGGITQLVSIDDGETFA